MMSWLGRVYHDSLTQGVGERATARGRLARRAFGKLWRKSGGLDCGSVVTVYALSFDNLVYNVRAGHVLFVSA